MVNTQYELLQHDPVTGKQLDSQYEPVTGKQVESHYEPVTGK